MPTLYHGTRAGFRGRGGLLLPATEHGGTTNHQATREGDREGYVYVTPDLDLAWAYAEAATGRGAPRVLVVVPDGPLWADDSTVGGEEQEAYRCGAAYVRSTIHRR